MMFQMQEQSITRLLETSQELHGKLIASPLWELLRTEPVIVNWISALNAVDAQLKKEQAPPDVEKTA